jgi:hypothetical protein
VIQKLREHEWLQKMLGIEEDMEKLMLQWFNTKKKSWRA